jgi:sugar diacid utilization regulator
VDWPWWIESIAKAAQTTGVEVTAAAAVAGAEHVPASAELVGELLDVVRWFGLPPALYRLEDLSVEYQLSRPGPARAALAALLDPLDRHPDLLTTVDAYGATQHNRRRTAGLLHVHPNTVVYRLRRIAELTGIDTATQRGLYQLGAGLAARRAERDTEGDR